MSSELSNPVEGAHKAAHLSVWLSPTEDYVDHLEACVARNLGLVDEAGDYHTVEKTERRSERTATPDGDATFARYTA